MSCLGVSLICSGGIAACGVDKRLVFALALKAKATKLVLAHNHPSGNLKPSQSDIEITQDFNRAGEILNINILDHLIITNDSYTSLMDEGLCTGSPIHLHDSKAISCL
ncbi:JAB domain-containing protein [Nemorincola caseinilytica]|uniref:JAB domain-containing protein n=1 Tax=Nemorincola caseinilytica TaxID=2054315 RepID=UPI0031EA7640